MEKVNSSTIGFVDLLVVLPLAWVIFQCPRERKFTYCSSCVETVVERKVKTLNWYLKDLHVILGPSVN